ncbi:MAG: autotransporter domain-containing protein [Betaproteobacteria bacterium]
MFRRLVAVVVLTMIGAAVALAQSPPTCVIENDFTGAIQGFSGNYTVYVSPAATGTLNANCTSPINSYNWSPGNAQAQQIQVTASATPGASVAYTLNACSTTTSTLICAQPVTITIAAVQPTAPNCTLSATPNPAISGQTVTFTASCNPAAADFEYTDFSGQSRVTQSTTFTDVAPAVTAQTVYRVFYVGFSSGGAAGVERVLNVTVLPPGSIVPPSNCALTAQPNPVELGASTTLTANCTAGGAATNYVFTNQAGAVLATGPANTLVVTPAALGAQIYRVQASNAGGNAQPMSVQVNVVQAQVPTGCTLTAQPNPISLGASTTLTATCTGTVTPTGYAFTGPGGNLASGASNTLVVTPTTVGVQTYSVVASSAQGSAVPASVQVNVLPAPPSACTLTAVPNPVTAGFSTTLTMTCVGGSPATSYAFTYPNGTIVPGTSASVSVLVPTAGTQTWSAVATNAGGGSTPATAQVVALPPLCTVTGSPVNPVPRNTSVTLTANCNNQPTSYQWSSAAGQIAGANGASLTVTPAVTTTYTVTASSSPATVPIIGSGQYTVVVSNAAVIATIAGSTVSGVPGRPLSRELQVRVTDLAANPVAGELVNWSVVNPGSSPGTFANNPSPATDAQGTTRNTFTMGTDPGGRTLRACLASLPSVCTDFQVVPGGTAIVAVAGTPLVGAPGRPVSRELQVRVNDAQGNPVAGETVNWTVVNPGPSPGAFAVNPSPPTDLQGITRNTFTMGNDPGGRTLRACLASLPTVCVDLAVRSLQAAVERPATKIMQPMAEVALATPLTQLSNIRLHLDQLRLRRNPAVTQGLKLSVGRQALPFSAFALAPLDKNGKPVPQTGGGASADDPFERLGAFVNGDVELGKQSATGQQSGFDLTTKGLTVGVDYRLPSDSVVGVTAGFMNANADLADGGGSQSARGYSFSAFGSFTPMAGSYVDVIAHAGSNKYDTRRRETDSGAPLDYLSNTRGNQYAFAVSAGADINRGALILNPYVRLDYVDAKINRFSESGDAGAIQVGDLNLRATVITLGSQASYAVSTSWGVLTPNARLELQRRVQGEGRTVNAALLADNSVSAQAQLEPIDRNYGNVSVGVSAILPRGISGFANFERLFGRDGYGNSKYTVGARFEF